MLRKLVEDPFPGTSRAEGILPLEDIYLNLEERYTRAAWTVPFDDALLVYEALADHPVIYLVVSVLGPYSEA